MNGYASIGEISSGTLRSEDLLSAFAWELEHLAKAEYGSVPSRMTEDNRAAYESTMRLIGEANDVDVESEEASELVNELQDALGEYAPPYSYFGASEGDGASFGFWPSMDSVNELPRVEGSEEAKALGEDCVYVNDHGNVTVYGGDGSVVWDCV